MRFGLAILPEHAWPVAESMWREADAMGFDHLWTFDHVTWAGLPESPWFAAVPTLANRGRLAGIPGVTPSLIRLPPGCAFSPRCAHAFAPCSHLRPELRGVHEGHAAACHLLDPRHAAAA